MKLEYVLCGLVVTVMILSIINTYLASGGLLLATQFCRYKLR
jgi:hypothetical protein